MKSHLFVVVALSVLTLVAADRAVAALKPDQIALVINKNVPESAELARYYAEARHIPEGRIIALDLPLSEEMPFERYEREVLPPLRKFLRDNGLKEKVKCLVTFFGVPLRIGERISLPGEDAELLRLTQTAKSVRTKLEQMVLDLEKQLKQLDETFTPASADTDLESLARRAAAASRRIALLAQSPDPELRQRAVAMDHDAVARFTAEVGAESAWPASAVEGRGPTSAPTEELVERPFDPAARNALRAIVRRSGGIFNYAKLIQDQTNYLTNDATASAVDSELALIWWQPYARTRWQPNTLNPHFQQMRAGPVVMTMRLDAPTPQQVRDLIANSILTERDGLKGKMVIDTRGIIPKSPPTADDAFGIFDEKLRQLAATVQSKTQMPVVLDEKSDVIPVNSVDDVALYCGWYSLRNYVPGMKFNRGAVGFHVASFELAGLHSPAETGWVHGLLGSGVVGTVGPVAEPYLHSFPMPEDFFPLLMTGKLTLAEVYWTTTPLTSWMQCFIGDPLYTPFATNPAFKPDDLPPVLRSVITP